MAIEKIKVSADEAKKYANVSRCSGEDFFEATIYTDAEGNIDPERTYTFAFRNKEKGVSKDETNAKFDRAAKTTENVCLGSCGLSSDFLEDASCCFCC